MANTKPFNETIKQAAARRKAQKIVRKLKAAAKARHSQLPRSENEKLLLPDKMDLDYPPKSGVNTKRPSSAAENSNLTNNMVISESGDEVESDSIVLSTPKKTTTGAINKTAVNTSTEADITAEASLGIQFIEDRFGLPAELMSSIVKGRTTETTGKAITTTERATVQGKEKAKAVTRSETPEQGAQHEFDKEPHFNAIKDLDVIEHDTAKNGKKRRPRKLSSKKKDVTIEVDEQVYYPAFMPMTNEQMELVARNGIKLNDNSVSKFVPNRNLCRLNTDKETCRAGIMKTMKRNHFNCKFQLHFSAKICILIELIVFEYKIEYKEKVQTVRWDMTSGLVHLRFMFDYFHPNKVGLSMVYTSRSS
jgi:hypothetical protein